MDRTNRYRKIYLFAGVCIISFVVGLYYFRQLPREERIYVHDDCSSYTKEKDRFRNTFQIDEKEGIADSQLVPSSLMEQTRRHISQTVRQQLLFMQSQIRELQTTFPNSSTDLQNKYKNTLKYMKDHLSEYSRVIDLETKHLGDLDGWDDWRKKEVNELRKIVIGRLMNLQNPRNCSTVPVLVCNLTNPSGFASGVHDVLWCFIKAYNRQNRLVLQTKHWHYFPSGWETMFSPLSDICQDNPEIFKKVSPWPIINGAGRWLMGVLPADLGPRIIRTQGNPLAWWYGQFLGYLMRPNEQLKSLIDKMLNQIKFSKGIVGIHVRRTDKVGQEASGHELEEYMEQAEEYFQSLELESSKSVKRRVYIATDEPKVIKECQEKYPQYECLYNPQSAETAFNLKTRSNNQSSWLMMVDIFILSQTDFIVCTMSSGLCRVAYELKLANDESSTDVSDKIVSIDSPHHYACITQPSRKAIYNHKSKASMEMSFSRGDTLNPPNSCWTIYATAMKQVQPGFMKISSQNKEKLVPVYKTREIFVLKNLTAD